MSEERQQSPLPAYGHQGIGFVPAIYGQQLGPAQLEHLGLKASPPPPPPPPPPPAAPASCCTTSFTTKPAYCCYADRINDTFVALGIIVLVVIVEVAIYAVCNY